MPDRLLTRMLARLSSSPLPIDDPIRLQLEAELIALLGRANGFRPRLRMLLGGRSWSREVSER